MAGTAKLGRHSWSTSSHVFYWVVDTLAEQATDAGLVDYLRGISTDNVGWLDADEVSPLAREELMVLVGRLPVLARELLPDSGEGRTAVIDQVDELAAMAGPPPG